MKRPFACIGFSMILSLVFAAAFHTAAPYCAAVCFILFAVLLGLNKIFKKNTTAATLCCIIACAEIVAYSLVVNFYVLPITNEFDGSTVDFSGMIISEPKTSGTTTSFTVRTDCVNGEKKKIKILVSSSYSQPAKIYDRIQGNAELSSVFEYGYGYSSYYGARKIFLSTYINPNFGSEYTVLPNNNRPFYAVFSDMRKAVANTFEKYLSFDEAKVCTAVVTGDKQYLSDEVYDNFKKLGISHILVVSGMHLSIIAGMVRLITRKTLKNRKASALLELVFIWGFALMTGMGFSVIRASIMLSLSTLAEALYEKADGIESLGVAGMILCIDPLNVGDIGLLWSFSCTLSIMLFAEPIQKLINSKFEPYRGINKIAAPVSASVSASIGSLPFLIFYIGAVSPYMIIINILLVPFSGIMIISAFVGAVLSIIKLVFAAKPFLCIAGLTAKLFIRITNFFCELPLSSVKTDNEIIYIWFFMSIIFITAFYMMNKKTVKCISMIAVLILVGIYVSDIVFSYDTVTFSVLDVGNGLTVTINKNDKIYLIDSSGEKYQYRQIKEQLDRFDCINCVFDTNYSRSEGYSYYRRIFRDFNAEKIVVCTNYKQKHRYAYQRYIGTDVIYADADINNMEIADSVSVTLIRTDNGVWQYVRIYDKDFLICPNGVDYEVLPFQYKNCDYIVMSELPKNMSFIGNTSVIISAYKDDCDKLAYSAENASVIYTTNGNGRIDVEYNGKGNVTVKQEYSGGVKRYASSE